MTDRIEPALTAQDWARGLFAPLSAPELTVNDDGDGLEFVTHDEPSGPLIGKYKIAAWDADGIAGVIALANAALPGDDPRKITHRTVAILRDAELFNLADVLESYLPPVELLERDKKARR